ncbi:amino acid transporter [Flammula alnicola]|nr:amino acid transporter [Flammula alnicola]
MGFNLIGVVPSIASVLMFSMPGGGTHGIIWAWAVCGVFLTAIALAVAEISSAAPTAGGMYNSTFMFSPPRYRRQLSWIVGYANTVGNIASVASVDWACSMMIMAAARIGSGFEFQATMAQTFGVYCALILCQGTICSLNSIVVARLQIPFVMLNVLLWLALIIALPTATPHMNTAKFVFGTFTNVNMAWKNNVFAFLLTFLSPLWAIGRVTSTLHISEESKNLKTAVPYAVILSTISSVIIGWGLNIVLAFCMGKDLKGVLSSPIGQPMATILFNSFGQRGMLAIWSFIIIAQFTMGTNMLTTTSRQIFAFARDGGLNFSKHLSTIDTRTRTPVTAVWQPIIPSVLLGLLAFAGPGAINSVFSLAVVAQFVAYTITIVSCQSGGTLGVRERRGAVSLGIFSLAVSIVAVVFMVVMSAILMFPQSEHPSAGSMNYTVLILGGVLLLSALNFYFPKYGGVHWFEGTVLTADRLDATEKERHESEAHNSTE